MGKHLNPLEKLELVKEFHDTPYATYAGFAREHNISESTFSDWVKKYQKGGLEALVRSDYYSTHLVPGTFGHTDEGYQLEILKLRIENERLKKNYMVKQSETGEKVFIRLKEKSSK